MSGGQSVADVLERAADLIEPEGAWTQHVYEEDDVMGPCAFCVVGAALHVSGLAYDRFKEPPNVPAALLGFQTWIEVMTWNDAPERTQAEVVAKLREAAAIARTKTGEAK